MSGQWKPGDVAMVQWSSEQAAGDGTVGNWTEVLSTRAHQCWIDASDPNFFVRDSPRDRNWRNARPLVVIDPEDRETCARLAREFMKRSVEDAEDMQDALRSLLAPPKPPEPLGLGAVVEDAVGGEWVRVRRGGPMFRKAADPNAGRYRSYTNIAAVRVLSEGVTQ